KTGDGLLVELGLPVEARRAIVGELLGRKLRVDALGKGARLLQVRMARLEPDQVGVRREGKSSRDAMFKAGAVLQAEEPLGRPLAGDERAVALVDVAGDELRAFRIGAGDDDCRDTAYIGREASRIEVADGRLGRDEDLATEVAAL